MPIIFAVLGTPLAHFAEGAILGATVYLVSRGKRNQLKNKKRNRTSWGSNRFQGGNDWNLRFSHMESILKWLFSSDLCIGREEKEERNLAKENAAVMDAAEKLSAGLPPELHQAWRNYMDQVERFQDLERQNEFERGFVVAVFLMMELINRGNQAGTTDTE